MIVTVFFPEINGLDNSSHNRVENLDPSGIFSANN